MKNDKLVTKQSADLSNIPEHLKHGQPAQGLEEMTREDLTIPRITICQANTPQRKKAEPSYIEGLDEGLIFNTVTNEIYGTSVTAIPLFFFKQRMKFLPLDAGGGIDCQSLNGVDGGRLHPSDCVTCPHAQFRNDEEDSRPECQLLLNYMLLLPKNQVAALSLKSTGLKAAKQLNAQVRMSNLDMFARTLTLTSVSMTKKGNQFYGPKLELGDFVPEPLYLAAKKFFTELREQQVHLDTRGLDGDEVEPGDRTVDDKNVPF